MGLFSRTSSDEVSPYDLALRRCAQNILACHREMLASAERQIVQLGDAMLRVANTMETQKPSHLIFSVRRPKRKYLLWWNRSMEERAELESEFIGMTSGELKWCVTFIVDLDPSATKQDMCYLCTKRAPEWDQNTQKMVWRIVQPVFHKDPPLRSAVATQHINHLLAVARRCIGAINTRSAEGFLYSQDPTLSISAPADLPDQVATGRVLSKRIVAELRGGVAASRENRL